MLPVEVPASYFKTVEATTRQFEPQDNAGLVQMRDSFMRTCRNNMGIPGDPLCIRCVTILVLSEGILSGFEDVANIQVAIGVTVQELCESVSSDEMDYTELPEVHISLTIRERI